MTGPTPYPAGDALPPGVQITFRDDLTRPESRWAAERSVATLVARSAEAVARARAADARRAEVAAALNAPLMKLVEADPAAVEALDALRAGHSAGLDLTDVVRREAPNAGADVVSLPRPRVLARVPPYDFTWHWFNPLGGPSFNPRLNNETGYLALEGRSGTAGGGSGFVDAHSGFGLILRTDRPVTAVGRSSRRMRFSFGVRAIGVGSNATTEGGMEFTALEDGNLVASASARLWRRRVSAGLSSGFDEEAHGGAGVFEVSEPSALVFAMQPGREYTFNVGAWVFTDRSPGAGDAAATCLIEGHVLALTIVRN
jgi:hypothetical protein